MPTVTLVPESSSTKTDSDGRFELSFLQPGSYLLELTHRTFARTYHRDLNVTEGTIHRAGDLVIGRGATIRGRVYRDGQPARARLAIHGQEHSDQYGAAGPRADTRSDGEFTLEHVPAGAWGVTALFHDNVNESRLLTVEEGLEYEIEFHYGDE